jgi:hypothetical protein
MMNWFGMPSVLASLQANQLFRTYFGFAVAVNCAKVVGLATTLGVESVGVTSERPPNAESVSTAN